ncbi:hypothetical protein ACVW1C_005713 [Bradyrhizobium sp. USDA 4011]
MLRLTDALPDVLLPHLAWAASRRQDVPARHVQVLVKCCGEPVLERALGRARLKQLKLRFPVSELFQPLWGSKVCHLTDLTTLRRIVAKTKLRFKS